jgi:hypothetical protein
MSLITQIRSMIQDQPLYQSHGLAAVAGQLTFQMLFFPVVGTSVIITPPSGSPPAFTVTDEQNGIVRFNAGALAGSYIFAYSNVMLLDSTIQDMIDIETDSDGNIADVRFIAADCLDAMATQMIIIQKKIKILDLQTDGPAMAKEMKATAATWRDLALNEPIFDMVELVYDRPSWAEKIYKDYLRETP